MDLHWFWSAGSGSGWAKRNRKKMKVKIIYRLSAGCSLLRAGGFACRLDDLRWRPMDKYIAIFDQKNMNLYFSVKFLHFLFFKTPGSGPGIHLMLFYGWGLNRNPGKVLHTLYREANTNQRIQFLLLKDHLLSGSVQYRSSSAGIIYWPVNFKTKKLDWYFFILEVNMDFEY